MSNLPRAEYRDRYEGRIDLWQKLHNSQVLTDAEIKQLFHAIDLAYYGAQTPSDRKQAEKAYQYAEDKLARNMVAGAPKTNAGEVVIHGVAVPKEVAYPVALADVRHFRQKNRHLTAQKLQAFGQETLQLGKDLASATMLMSTGALKGVTLGYVDLTDDAKQAGQIMGANPAIAENPYFNPQTVGDFLGSSAGYGVGFGKLASAYAARKAAKRVIFSTEQQLAKVYMRHVKALV